jgi:cytochrome c556
MIRPVIAIVALAAGATFVAAQQDPVAARKELMKSNGAQARAAGAMVKGEAPFDLAKAKAIFVTVEGNAAKLKELFPAGSDKGDTAALPKIWEDKADFERHLAKLASDAKAAASAVTDLDSFKAQFAAVGKVCGGCHQTYRAKKS